MSVVLCYADKSSATIACDGRVIDENGNIVDESFQKFMKVNDSVIVGYAGSANLCQAILAPLQNPDQQDFVKQLSLEQIYGFIRQSVFRSKSSLKSGFLICGKSNSGVMGAASLNRNYDTGISCLAGDHVFYSGIYPEELGNEDIFIRYLNRFPFKKAMKETIKYCSKRSDSVNDSVYYLSLHLRDQKQK